MARCHINIEDREDGTFDAQVVYVEGFLVSSHAHQHANLLMKYLDRIASSIGTIPACPPLPELVVSASDPGHAPNTRHNRPEGSAEEEKRG